MWIVIRQELLGIQDDFDNTGGCRCTSLYNPGQFIETVAYHNHKAIDALRLACGPNTSMAIKFSGPFRKEPLRKVSVLRMLSMIPAVRALVDVAVDVIRRMRQVVKPPHRAVHSPFARVASEY